MKKFHKKSLTKVCLIAALVIILDACQKDSPALEQGTSDATTGTTTTLGREVALCNGKVQSFVIKDAEGNPKSIGFSFSEDVLSKLPDKDTETPIPVPAGNGTLIDHMAVDWNVHGHEPAGIYDKPHFDVHFYMIPESEQMAIDTGAKMEVLPPAEFIAPDYQPIPSGVPMMGKHWADVTAKEFHGQPFDRTFIYGSYNGKFIFFEPMVTLAYLQSKQSFTDDIKQEPKVQRDGYYPKTYSVTYDASKKMYTISLNELTLRHM